MSYPRLIRSELRKLTSTKMPWAFLAVVAVIAAINASAVIWGTDFDGSKAFVSTAADQQSMMAFASNAIMLAALLGTIAAAREYAHQTVIPTFLAEPRRHRAMISQLASVSIAGGLVGLIGAALTIAAVALSVPTTEYSFLVSAGGVTRVLLASTFAGAAGPRTSCHRTRRSHAARHRLTGLSQPQGESCLAKAPGGHAPIGGSRPSPDPGGTGRRRLAHNRNPAEHGVSNAVAVAVATSSTVRDSDRWPCDRDRVSRRRSRYHGPVRLGT